MPSSQNGGHWFVPRSAIASCSQPFSACGRAFAVANLIDEWVADPFKYQVNDLAGTLHLLQ
jgi:hypothetical protein